MSETYTLEEQYELFEGDIRRLDELIGQLELWSDEYTINHKKEQVRLPQYMELHLNLEELKAELQQFIESHGNSLELKERIKLDQQRIDDRLEEYNETQETIHNWIREIEDVHDIIMKSEVLQENRAFIENIIED